MKSFREPNCGKGGAKKQNSEKFCDTSSNFNRKERPERHNCWEGGARKQNVKKLAIQTQI